jgi:hypothetical protein
MESEFRKFMDHLVPSFETLPLPIPGYIAKCIAVALNNPANDPEDLIRGAGRVRFDLNNDGSYKTATKRITVQDKSGVFYEVTVKQINR